MAQKVRLEFNSDGFEQILMSEEVREMVQGYAEDIAEKANANSGLDSFRATTDRAPTRIIGFASSTDKASFIAESEDKALTRALT